MERAEPASVRTAASTSAAFMSFILVLAISSSCSRVILSPGLQRVEEPFSSLMASLIKVVAGGVLMMKVKLLSGKTP